MKAHVSVSLLGFDLYDRIQKMWYTLSKLKA